MTNKVLTLKQNPLNCSDPRTRQLAEKQKIQQNNTRNEPVPEKLSFKEKMKMFALDAGENQTPKDKLKISRAQRDIDAVH
jgi:afadin